MSNGTILGEIAAKTRLRVEKAKLAVPFEQVREQALALAENNIKPRSFTEEEKSFRNTTPCSSVVDSSFSFERAISQPGLSFICEVKKASPSKGIIAADFPWLEIAREYEAAGAAAISVLTEPDYFLGSDVYLFEIAQAVTIPALRKDFIIDVYQIYEAKVLGAKAVLLICALLDTETLAAYINTAAELGLSALVETHSESEIDHALAAGARIIGINNRNLKTFAVDPHLSVMLRSRIPAGVIVVAESGIQSPDDIKALRDCDINAVLIGEALMRSADKKRFLQELQAAYGGDIG